MTISTKIALIFSIISSFVLIIFGVSVYIISKNHIEYDFSERLKKRVDITENFFLEKQSFSKEEFIKIKTQFSHTLNKEKEEVVELSKTTQPKFNTKYSKQLIEQLIHESNLVFIENNRQGASKIFNVNHKKFLIIVTAYNEQGQDYLAFLMSRIILLINLGIPFLFILFIFITRQTLSPISKKIELANKISANNLHERLKVINPKDELGQMALAFNNLLDRLEKSFEAQKLFITNASHEIKNPLTAIMGEAEIAASKERSSKEYLASFNIILTESERLNLTVNNLLQLSKVSADEFSISFTKINFHTFFNQLIASYNFINPNNRLLKTKILTQNIVIKGNRDLLKTAITNLLDNACKFSNNQTVELETVQKGKHIILNIKDYGIGIPKKDISKITEPFFRASNTISVKGSGIGLSLTKKIIALHHGDFFIDSKENIGTTITIKFPIAMD